MKKSRIQFAAINVSAGIVYQIVNVLIKFISRTIFIQVLGEQYLGLSGLYSNILSIFSLAELGIGSAIIFSMYEPLRSRNEEKLSALVTYYKILYRRIAMIVMVLGLALLPFLDFFIRLEEPIQYQKVYYLLYLLNSVFSYLFIYKSSIITADQKDYKLKLYIIVSNIIKFILQLIVLIFLRSFLLYVVVQIVCSVAVNYICSKKAEWMYPFINEERQLSVSDKNYIWENIKSMFCYQIGSVSFNGTDNIIISVLVGTIGVGYYSNYSMVVGAVAGFTSLIFTSIQASMGSLNSENNREHQYIIFKVLNFISFWVYGFCAVSFCTIFQDFISVWIGQKYLLSNEVVFIIILNYYITGILFPIYNYRMTIGLFRYTKYVMLMASVVNIILSIIGGIYWGISGVLVATAVARLTTYVWFEPYKLYHIYFKKKVKTYYFQQMVYIAVVIITALLLNWCLKLFAGVHPIAKLVIDFGCCAIIPNIVFFVLFRKTEEFQFILNNIVKKLFVKQKDIR